MTSPVIFKKAETTFEDEQRKLRNNDHVKNDSKQNNIKEDTTSMDLYLNIIGNNKTNNVVDKCDKRECPSCGEMFSGRYRDHLVKASHVMAMQRKGLEASNISSDDIKVAYYNRSSKGFSMAQQMGWSPGTGLGRSNSGIRVPLRTRRRDRRGIGNSVVDLPMAVTHKDAHLSLNKKASQIPFSHLSKKQRLKLRQRAAAKDAQIKRVFYQD